MIKNHPFSRFFSAEDIERPLLKINIINPKTKSKRPTFALIDTGADECAIPAWHAESLGHILRAVSPALNDTAGGLTDSFPHSTEFEILDQSGNIVYSISKSLVDFNPKLHMPILGMKNFLSDFILTIDYPKKVFSLKKP